MTWKESEGDEWKRDPSKPKSASERHEELEQRADEVRPFDPKEFGTLAADWAKAMSTNFGPVQKPEPLAIVEIPTKNGGTMRVSIMPNAGPKASELLRQLLSDDGE